MRTTLKQLQMVAAIAERQGISRAAEAMNVSQPSLTRSLRELEATLGVSLFERTPRGMLPTVYGDVLVRRGKAVERELRGAGEEIEALGRGGAGRVVLGVTLLGAATLAPRALASFCIAWPKVAVELYEARDDAELAARLAGGDIDLAVRLMRAQGREDGLDEDYLLDLRLGVWGRVGHPLEDRGAISLGDLLTYGWVLPSRKIVPRPLYDKVFQDDGLGVPRAVVETPSLAAIHALLRQTDWLSVLPDFSFPDDAAVRALPVTLPGAWQTIGLAQRHGATLSPAARALAEEIRKTARENYP